MVVSARILTTDSPCTSALAPIITKSESPLSIVIVLCLPPCRRAVHGPLDAHTSKWARTSRRRRAQPARRATTPPHTRRRRVVQRRHHRVDEQPRLHRESAPPCASTRGLSRTSEWTHKLSRCIARRAPRSLSLSDHPIARPLAPRCMPHRDRKPVFAHLDDELRCGGSRQ